MSSQPADPHLADPPPANYNGPVAVSDEEHYDTLHDLIRQAQPDKVQRFLESYPSFDLNFVPRSKLLQGESLLHLACEHLDESDVDRFLALGANPRLFCGYGRNALQCAALADRLDSNLLKLLTRNLTKEDKKDYIDSPDEKGDLRATHYAVESPSTDVEGVGVLVAAGANLKLKNRKGNTPYEWAAKHRRWLIIGYLAALQWGAHQRKDDHQLTDNYHWLQVHVQNTSYIQSIVWDWWNMRDKIVTGRVLQHVTPDFRCNRTPEDPVGGSGREAICNFKKLGHFNFESIAIPYFSSSTIYELAKNRTNDYPKATKDLSLCSDNNFNSLGLQCASTLDEYCHPNLDKTTLQERNDDQVLGRYQEGKPEDQKVILTVPQRWIWAIDKNIITATTQENKSDELEDEIFSTILSHGKEIQKTLTPKDTTLQRDTLFGDIFIGIIISECVNKLSTLSHFDSPELPDTIFGVFERSISQLSAEARKYTQREALTKNDMDSETKLTLQIGDVREELSMIRSVIAEQKKIWEQFMKAKLPEFWPDFQQDKFLFNSSDRMNRRALELVAVLERPQTQFAKYSRQIDRLDADAERVQASIILQLDLKSKHASLREAQATTLMSAAIIGFTVVTIIFTPLAFLVGLFALSINVFQTHQHKSSLENGPPYYHISYVRKGLIAIEFASLAITILAIWLALKVTTDFSIRAIAKRIWKRAKLHLSPKEEEGERGKPRKMADKSVATGAAQEEREPTVQQPAAQQPAVAGQPAPLGDGNHTRQKFFQTGLGRRRQQHVEAGHGQ